MAALARALPGRVWLIWLGLIFTAQIAWADGLPVADLDGGGQQDAKSLRVSTIAAGPRLDDGQSDPADDTTPQKSFTVNTPSRPFVEHPPRPAHIVDPSAAPASSRFSTNLGPRPPPHSR